MRVTSTIAPAMTDCTNSIDQVDSAKPIDWSSCACAIALVLAFAIALCPNNVDSDLWGHVLYGQDVLRDGQLPATATYTFTADGYRWINHENLAELILAVGLRNVGVPGLMTMKVFAGLLVIGLMLRHAIRQEASPLVAAVVLLLVAVCLTAFWALRPQILSCVCLALMVASLNEAFRDWRTEVHVDRRWLSSIPLLFVVWANSHGAFVAGLALLMTYLGGRGVEALVWRRPGWLRHVTVFLAVGITAGLATLLNPYGPALLEWLASSLTRPRPENSEWVSPSPQHDFYLPFTLVVATTIVSWIASQRPRDWVQFALLALCVWQAYMHLRHIALLAVVVGFWIPAHVQSALDRWRHRSPFTNRQSPRWQTACTTIAFGGLIIVLTLRLQSRLEAIEVRRDDYPVAAFQFMHEHRLGGKLVVSFSWAQYAIAALSPDVSVAFDGRFRTCYPQEVLDMHFDFQIGEANGHRHRSDASGPIDGHRVLQHGSPDLVLVDRRFSHSVDVMKSQTEFSLLYQDSLAQLWGRKTRFDDVTSADYFSVDERSVSDAQQWGVVPWPAFPYSLGGR